MKRQLTTKEVSARSEAYEEAAGHLCLNWTDDPEEIRQGKIVAKRLRRLSVRLMRRFFDGKAKS